MCEKSQQPRSKSKPLQSSCLGTHFNPSSQANISVEQGGVQRESDSSEPSSHFFHPSHTYNSEMHSKPSAQANLSAEQERKFFAFSSSWWRGVMVARGCVCGDLMFSKSMRHCIWFGEFACLAICGSAMAPPFPFAPAAEVLHSSSSTKLTRITSFCCTAPVWRVSLIMLSVRANWILTKCVIVTEFYLPNLKSLFQTISIMLPCVTD